MKKGFCETCPMAGSCGTDELTELIPLGKRKVGSFIEPTPQAVLGTVKGGISQPFYLDRDSAWNMASIRTDLGVHTENVRNCPEPVYEKSRSFLGVLLVESSTNCRAIGTGYTLDMEGTRALVLNKDELRGPLREIVAKHFVS